MYNHKETQDPPYDPTKLAIRSILSPEFALISNFGHYFKTNVSFDDIVQFIDEEKIVKYVDFVCFITFYPEAPTEVGQINSEQNGRTSPHPVKTPSAFQVTINLGVLLMSSISLKLFRTHTVYRTRIRQLLCHSTTVLIGTLSIQYRQAKTH